MAPDEKPYRVYRGGREGQGAAAVRARSTRSAAPGEASRRSGAPTAVAAAPRAQVGRHPDGSVFLPLARGVEPGRLLLVPGRRQAANKRLPAAGEARARRSRRPPAHEPDDDPPARDGHASRRRARATATPTRSCSCAPTPTTTGIALPLDPARPAGRHPRLRVGRRSTPHTRSAGPRSRSGRSRRSPASTIDHVVVVDFAALQGADRPHRRHRRRRPAARSSRTASTARSRRRRDAQSWTGWRFEKGTQHMDGRRALVYSRIRENQLDPADNDITRGERQQQVAQAITEQARRRRHVPPPAVHRRRPAEAARDRPLGAGSSSSSAG